MKIKALVIILSVLTLVTSCKSSAVQGEAAPPGVDAQSQSETEREPPKGEKIELGQAAAEEEKLQDSTLPENTGYNRVLKWLNWNFESCYLEDVTSYLTEEGLIWEAYYNVTGERVDMMWEDGTTLLFLASNDDSRYPKSMKLIMVNDSFDDKGFKKDYLNQADEDKIKEYFPQTADRILEEEELWDMNQTELSIARAEILARHGKKFQDAFLKAVFTRKSWYQPLYEEEQFAAKEEELFNDYEKENLKTIRKVEEARGFALKSEENARQPKSFVQGSFLSVGGAGRDKISINYSFDLHFGGPGQADGYELALNSKTSYAGWAEGGLIGVEEAVYSASLDSKTVQLLIYGKEQSYVPMTDVYYYRGEELQYAGRIWGGRIEILDDCFYVYRQLDESSFSDEGVKYVYQYGKITEVSEESPVQKADTTFGKRLSDLKIDEQYKQFLYGNKEIANSFNRDFPLSFYAEESIWEKEEYLFPKESLNKYFALVDVNDDGAEELIYKINSGNNKIMYIIGLVDGNLTVYDLFETQSRRVSFTVYANGNSLYRQDYSGEEEVFYEYDENGRPKELIHFVSSEKWLAEKDNKKSTEFEYYYLNGNESEPVYLSKAEDYGFLASRYLSDGAIWHNLADYSDISIVRVK